MRPGSPAFERLAHEVAQCEKAWRAGRADALAEAFVLCAGNDFPFPMWLFEAVLAILDAEHAKGKRGRAAARTAAADEMNDLHRTRWLFASIHLDWRKTYARHGRKVTREGAFELASHDLRGTPAQGAPGAIERSYNIVETAIREGRGHLFGIRETRSSPKPT
jgi:hypothetical protein